MSSQDHEIKKSASVKARRIIAYVVLTLLSILCLFWFYLLIVYATHSHGEVTGDFLALPGKYLGDNWKAINGGSEDILRGLRNSFIVSGANALVCVYFSTMTAYDIHVYDFKGKKFAFTFILMIMMIPTQVTILGFLGLIGKMGLTENFLPLILPAIASPVTFYYLKQYMESALPLALIEAARIDGSGELRTFNTIALPLMKPAIAVQAIFSFVGAWNNYFVPSHVLIKKDQLKTIPILIAQLRSKDFKSFNMASIYLFIALSIFPVIIVYLALSKNIVGGTALGAVKG